MSALRVSRPGIAGTTLIDLGPACGRVLHTRGPVAPLGGMLVVAESEATRKARMHADYRARGVLTERQQEIARIVAKHGGNRTAAARELGVTGSSVVTTLNRMRRLGHDVP
jgi:DNA-binding CsgD family transcriptional regulator